MVKVIKAKIKLYQGEHVRKTPFVTGYRPLFSFGGSTNNTSGQIILIDRDKFYPGQEGIVQIRFLAERLDENFNINANFIFREGREILGEGVVLELHDEKTKF